MNRQDLRSRIIPTTIENTDESQNTGNKKFNTTDLIYLDSYDEQYDGKKTDMERRISATDYAQMNYAYTYDNYTTRTGKQTTRAWLRSAWDRHNVNYVDGDGDGNRESSVIAPDVQNLVVRNSKGDIISKGTMYVNKARGYAVINDFELNGKYRHHESSSGRYSVEETSPEEQDREMIFKAFQRGLRAFIEEYDRQNPKNPLTQINIGMGYNRLKKQVERFKKATSNLTVPSEYSFQDAMTNEQHILYQREQKQIENGGQDR